MAQPPDKNRARSGYKKRRSVVNRTSPVGAKRADEREVTVMTGGQIASVPNMAKSVASQLFQLYNPDDLLGRKGFAIYRDMRNDDTVKACLSFKKVLISGRTWEIEPAGGKDATDEQKTQAKFVEDVLQSVNMTKIMREQLTALDFGFSVGEINWLVTDWRDLGIKIVVKDIKFRDPQWMLIDVDAHGNIMQFRQQSPGYYANSALPYIGIQLEPDKVVHYAHQSEFSNHYGISDLRAAYAAWWSKKFVTQFYNVFLERFGQPLMAMKYPQGASQELKNALKNILTNLSTKSDILVPEGVNVELIEATRSGTAKYDEALTYADIRISRAILVPALLGMGGPQQRSTDSQSRLHLRTLFKVANEVSIDLEHIYTQKLVEPLVDMNFAGVTEFPSFKFRDYGEYEAVEIVDSAINMFNAGMLDANQDDINYLRSILGFDMREEGDEDEVMRAPPPPVGTSPNNPNDSGAGAGKNNARSKKGPATRVVKPK
jgi:phage gp29-like protein